MKLKLILLVCAMLIALTGCFNDSIEHETSQPVGEEYNEGKGIIEKLILEDFKKALQFEGLELMLVEEERNDWILNNNKPNKFTVGSPLENTDPTKLERVSIVSVKSYLIPNSG